MCTIVAGDRNRFDLFFERDFATRGPDGSDGCNDVLKGILFGLIITLVGDDTRLLPWSDIAIVLADLQTKVFGKKFSVPGIRLIEQSVVTDADHSIKHPHLLEVFRARAKAPFEFALEAGGHTLLKDIKCSIGA